MKIAFITSFYGKPYGGAELSTRILLNELNKKGHQVCVFTTRNIKEDKNTIIIPKTSWIPKKLMILGNPILDKHIAEKIREKIEIISPDVIHIQDTYILPSSVLVSEKLGIPSVVTIRNNTIDSVYDMITPYPISHLLKRRNKAIKKYLKRTNAIISVSEYIKNELIQHDLDPNKIYPIYNLPPLWDSSKIELRKNTKEVIIFAPGRLTKEKGFFTIINALNLVLIQENNVKLIVAGDGPERKTLESLAHKSGLDNHVIFIGNVSHDDIMKQYINADIILLSSIHPECFSRIPLETMLAEKPIIATNVGGNPEAVIDGVNGILIPPDNPNSMANAILKLVKNPIIRRNMGVEGKKILKEKFDTEKIVNKTVDVYRSIVRRE